MNARRLSSGFCLSVFCLAPASPAFGLVNRVFASARSGNDANACDDVNLPCKTFAGAVAKLNPDGEVIVLDSGGYGPVTITQGVTIEAPPGVTAFIHPPSGDAITVNAGAGTVTLRGLVLNGGVQGITVNSVGTLNVENCFITGFSSNGIRMSSAGRLNVKGTDITACGFAGIQIANTAGSVQASVDHCHLDGNTVGYYTFTMSPGSSATTASYTTANHNFQIGWLCGNSGTTGKDVLNLEFCIGSENLSGLQVGSANAQSVARYSNCVFANNGLFGVAQFNAGALETRGNNTITGNASGDTSGTIGTFLPK